MLVKFSLLIINPYALWIIISSPPLGTITTLSSYHWILTWVGLEINYPAIISLVTKTFHPWTIESATKYILTQAAALILFYSTIFAWITEVWDLNIYLNDASGYGQVTVPVEFLHLEKQPNAVKSSIGGSTRSVLSRIMQLNP